MWCFSCRNGQYGYCTCKTIARESEYPILTPESLDIVKRRIKEIMEKDMKKTKEENQIEVIKLDVINLQKQFDDLQSSISSLRNQFNEWNIMKNPATPVSYFLDRAEIDNNMRMYVIDRINNECYSLRNRVYGLENTIKELEAKKPKDNSEYEFYLREDMNIKTFIEGWPNGTNYYYLKIYKDRIGMMSEMAELRLNIEQLQTIVDTLQKVINDKVLR